MSEPEANRIRKQIPEETDPPEVWRAKQKAALREIKRSLSSRKNILEQGGYILGEAPASRDIAPTVGDQIANDELTLEEQAELEELRGRFK